jgi:hypothetical protein
MQKDLDVFLVEYDEKRPNQGGDIARHDPYGRIQEGAGITANQGVANATKDGSLNIRPNRATVRQLPSLYKLSTSN